VAIFYADENVSLALNDALRTYGHEVFTTRDERRLGAADSGQLLYAAERGWIVLTHNQGRFRPAPRRLASLGACVAYRTRTRRDHRPRTSSAAAPHGTCHAGSRPLQSVSGREYPFRLEACDGMDTKSAIVNAIGHPHMKRVQSSFRWLMRLLLHAQSGGWYTRASPRRAAPQTCADVSEMQVGSHCAAQCRTRRFGTRRGETVVGLAAVGLPIAPE